MILTTSYLFSHLSPDSTTLYITPYTPPVKRNSNELIPIEVAKIAYFVRHQTPSSDGRGSSQVSCYYLGKNSDSSYNTFKFTLDADSPGLPTSLEHLVVRRGSDAQSRRPVELVFNPKSGHGYSTALLNDVVLPLLKPLEEADLFAPARIWETQGKNDGERIGKELAKEDDCSDKTVIILGGDGTVHEVLNGAVSAGSTQKSLLDLVLIPTGTANAMYFHLFPPESPAYPTTAPVSAFYSLVSFLRQTSSPLALPLAHNTISRRSNPHPNPPPTLTSVVTSAALHACLLHDAEELRESHPGVERFKLAAQENVKIWWSGVLALRGARRYDSRTKKFEVVDPQGEEEEVKLEGPFAYWVSSLISRFEPNFVVAPLRSPQHELAPSPVTNDASTIDLVVIRPLRHIPTGKTFAAQGDQEAAKKTFADIVWGVTGGMYDGGKHVDMVYPEGEGIDDIDQRGGDLGSTEIVEVFRVNEFSWTPTASSDLKSNLVCFDGALHDLGEGGSLSTRVLGTDQTGVRIWR